MKKYSEGHNSCVVLTQMVTEHMFHYHLFCSRNISVEAMCPCGNGMRTANNLGKLQRRITERYSKLERTTNNIHSDPETECQDVGLLNGPLRVSE